MASAVSKFKDQLDDLSFGSLDTAAEPKVQKIQLDQISSDPANPRKSFDKEELSALARSITERGLLQPITLRKLGPKSYVIRFGDRRFRAARIAGLATIDAIVAEGAVGEFDIVDQIVENDQRVNLTAREMAAAVTDMLGRGMKHKEIATRLGRDVKTVGRLASVVDMPPLFQELLDTAALRTVCNLHQLWAKEPTLVEAFIKDTLVEDMTRARVEQLISSVGGQGGDGNTESDILQGGRSDQPTESKIASRPATVDAEGRRSDVAVVINGQSGRLVLGTSVRVIFDGEDAPRSVKVR